MARLSLSLLGTFQVTLDGALITGFESNKVRALLVYLAVESNRPHHREKLAGLLWPERPEQNARQNLSQALYNLRYAIGDRTTLNDGEARPPFLRISSQTLQFNRSSNYWLDVEVFSGLLAACEEHGHRQAEVCDLCLERLQQAVALYQGKFLNGFPLAESSLFEDWCRLEEERLHHLAMRALRRLADCHEQRGEIEAALQYAQRQVELDPWREEAHRQLMRLLVLSGQRGAALAQYKVCHRHRAEELGVEPEVETKALYECICSGELVTLTQ